MGYTLLARFKHLQSSFNCIINYWLNYFLSCNITCARKILFPHPTYLFPDLWSFGVGRWAWTPLSHAAQSHFWDRASLPRYCSPWTTPASPSRRFYFEAGPSGCWSAPSCYSCWIAVRDWNLIKFNLEVLTICSFFSFKICSLKVEIYVYNCFFLFKKTLFWANLYVTCFIWIEFCAKLNGWKRLQAHHPTSKFSNLCFSDCKVWESCVKVSAGPLDTSPMVFLVPVSFLLPPGRASPGSTPPLWLSHRANFEVSSRMVSFWLIIISFCCSTVSRSCITVVFKSSPGTLFCNVAAQMSTSLGTDVQMNCVCPAKSWDKLSKNTQEKSKTLQENPLLVAHILP